MQLKIEKSEMRPEITLFSFLKEFTKMMKSKKAKDTKNSIKLNMMDCGQMVLRMEREFNTTKMRKLRFMKEISEMVKEMDMAKATIKMGI